MTVMNLYPEAEGGDGARVEGAADHVIAVEDRPPPREKSLEHGTTQESSLDTDAQDVIDGNAGPPPARWWMRLARSIVRTADDWPRAYALLFHVMLPLLSLIVLSIGFGYWLANVEAPEEIKKNNGAISVRQSLAFASQLDRIIMREGPTFCVGMYLNKTLGEIGVSMEQFMLDELDATNVRLYDDFMLLDKNGDGIRDEMDVQGGFAYADQSTQGILKLLGEHNVTSIDNITDFLQFVTDCGNKIDEMVNQTTVTAIVMNEGIDAAGTDVTFNWIKCPAGLDDESYMKVVDGDHWLQFLETFRLAGAGLQEKYVVRRWKESHHRLFSDYYTSYQALPNTTRLEARDMALGDSARDADGFAACQPDSVAGAWFWFVVMTTIGYGNDSPVTRPGRAMVFTFGFLCILTFGSVLARAGSIVTTVFEDGVRRYPGLGWLGRTWVEMIFWGLLFYAWLCAIAASAVAWKRVRVGEEMDFGDAYWFSFISITTVGFGDYYLEHEAIALHDVVGFAMLFLVGFVLLANFLTVMRELLESVGGRGRPTFSERLEECDTQALPKGPND